MKKLFISRDIITKVKGSKKSIAIEVMRLTSIKEIGDIDILFFERENSQYAAYGAIRKDNGFDMYHIGFSNQEFHIKDEYLIQHLKSGIYSMAGYAVNDAVEILRTYTDYSGEFKDFVEDAERYLKNKNMAKEEVKTQFRTNVEVHNGDADIIVKFNKEQDYDDQLKFAEKVQEFANNLYEQMFHDEDEDLFEEFINILQGKSKQETYDILKQVIADTLKNEKK